ncbi:hypothetical protein PHYPSEUDO_013800 [Phytophthora pseudosyringae]|uniref:Uncharacterized protein n=1 Tax=Phytophthora pseudosyringae TaxID=221518 RepID=A0A8T1W691_9STRA|nr:hypothetical protein PHYPSEUDO_013800 [Phytophthora pseudosyringae]
MGTTVDVAVHGGLWLTPGERQYVQISLGKHDPKALDVWAGRGDRWVTLIAFSSQKVTVAARVANISKHTLEVLPHTRVATLTETDRLPLGTNFVRPGSYKYEERGFLVYENTRSRATERRLDAEARELERNAPPAVERPPYSRPTGIRRRPDPSSVSRPVAMAVPSSSQLSSVRGEDVSGATTTTYDYAELPGGASTSEIDAEQELARVFPVTKAAPAPSALAQSFMMVATAGDTLDADPAVYFHQGPE